MILNFLAVPDDSKIKPTIHRVDQGQAVFFTCESDSETVWRFNGQGIPENAITYHHRGSKEYQLYLYSVQLTNSGKYACEGVDEEVGYGFVATGELQVRGKQTNVSIE